MSGDTRQFDDRTQEPPVPQKLDYASPRSGSSIDVWSPKFRAIAWRVIVYPILFGGIIFLLYPATSSTRGRGQRGITCVSHIHKLISLAYDHAQRNNGVLAQNLQLLQPPTNLMSPKQFSELLASPTTSKPFIYVGAGINLNTAPPNTILIYEPPINHKDPKTGKAMIHVGYKDGSVIMVEQPFADKIIAELNAGHNPPRPAVTGFVR